MKLVIFDSVQSTNACAEEYGREGHEEPALFIAKSQSGGRGRLGRSFSSAEGGLYMSLCLPAPQRGDNAMGFTAFCGVITAQMIERATGLNIGIKWVNDLILDGKKLGGIITKGIISSEGELTHLVVGIGVNIRNPLPGELEPIATSLAKNTDKLPDPVALGVAVAEEIISGAEDFLAPSLREEYSRSLTLTGREVTVYSPKGEYSARVVGIGEDYSLLVEREGEIYPLYSGEISVRDSELPHANPYI